MFRALAFVCAAAFGATAIAGPEGEWYCTGNAKSVINMNGKSIKSPDTYSAYMTLNPNGTYIGRSPTVPFPSTGGYRVHGKNVIFFPNLGDLAKAAEYGCVIGGQACKVIAVAGKSKGKMARKASRIKLQTDSSITVIFQAINTIARIKGRVIGSCDRL